MLWLNFLHLYQPANIEKEKIIEATNLSYERIIRALEENPGKKFTLNISGCLVIRWAEELGYLDLINRIKKLISRGQIELVGSAAYHAFLPLTSEQQTKEQIRENEKILKKYFGRQLKLKGFFSPEMAYSARLAKLIKKLGYRWLILDEIAAYGKLNKVKPGKKYIDQSSGLALIFRNRKLSDSYVPQALAGLLKQKVSPPLIITASDAELYGLRHIDHKANFEKLLKNKKLTTATLSQFIDGLSEREKITPLASSWQSSEAELKKNQPYSLWYNKNNKVQNKLWQLANLAEKLFRRHRNDKNTWWSRWHLVRGLASCTFWWASGKDFSSVFGPISWGPDEVERGINELLRSIRALEKSTDLKTKLTAEKLALETRRLLWQRHWNWSSIKK